MAKAWAATADMTPIPPRTDKTMPAKFMRVLTTVVVGAEEGAEAEEGVPPAAALFTEAADTDDIL